MNKTEFGILVETIKSSYKKKDFLSDICDKKLWYGMLRDLEFQTAAENLERHIKSNNFIPTIAEIRNDATGFERNYNMDKLELALLGIKPVGSIEEVKCGRIEQNGGPV